MYYPKIDTLFDRGEDFNVDLNRFRRPEFAFIGDWLVMEKLDGANISIYADRDGTKWRGRTSKANFIPDITNHLNLLVESWHDPLQAKIAEHKLDSLEIFGEVYGPKVQAGGIYSTEIKTKFYDIRVNQNLWLDHATLLKYALELGFGVPQTGFADLNKIIYDVSHGFETFEKGGTGGIAEGLIAKTEVPLYNNAGKRLIWKLKHKDFTHGGAK